MFNMPKVAIKGGIFIREITLPLIKPAREPARIPPKMPMGRGKCMFVMTAVFITNMHLPLPIGILGGILAGSLAGFINGNVISRMKIPPFIATLGMLNIARGLSLVISELHPIYFNDTPAFREMAMGSVVGKIIPGFDVPNAVFIMFGAAIIANLILSRTILG